MKSIRAKEMRAQAELYEHLGEELIDSLSDSKRAALFALWRDILNDWEAHHNGEPPNSGQMEWILGVWVNTEPMQYIESLKDEPKQEQG